MHCCKVARRSQTWGRRPCVVVEQWREIHQRQHGLGQNVNTSVGTCAVRIWVVVCIPLLPRDPLIQTPISHCWLVPCAMWSLKGILGWFEPPKKGNLMLPPLYWAEKSSTTAENSMLLRTIKYILVMQLNSIDEFFCCMFARGEWHELMLRALPFGLCVYTNFSSRVASFLFQLFL